MATLFGKEIQIKRIGCNQINIPGRPLVPAVMLFVKTTNACNARCAFCSNAECRNAEVEFDAEKLMHVIDEIRSSGLAISRINFTGGEPSIASEKVVLPLLERLSNEEYRNLFLHLNTNGVLKQSRELMLHPRWNSISVSLHHYDRNHISELYGVDLHDDLDFSQFNREGLILSASCNLIKGYIDSETEVVKMMNHALDVGIGTLGFVSLMKVNDYCREHYVDFSEIDWLNIPHLYYTGSKDRGKDCKCSNYICNNRGRVLNVYMRNYMNPNYCESSLLYDGQYLRQGFHDDNIIY